MKLRTPGFQTLNLLMSKRETTSVQIHGSRPLRLCYQSDVDERPVSP